MPNPGIQGLTFWIWLLHDFLFLFYINISKLLKNTEKINIKNHFKIFSITLHQMRIQTVNINSGNTRDVLSLNSLKKNMEPKVEYMSQIFYKPCLDQSIQSDKCSNQLLVVNLSDGINSMTENKIKYADLLKLK
jgi:hypothetical protein